MQAGRWPAFFMFIAFPCLLYCYCCPKLFVLLLKTTVEEIIMAYVDGFVVPVPKAKLDAYLAMSRTWRHLARTGRAGISRMRGRRCQAGKMDLVPAGGGLAGWRSGGVFLDHLRIARQS